MIRIAANRRHQDFIWQLQSGHLSIPLDFDRKEKLAAPHERSRGPLSLIAIIPDGFDGAAFLGFLAQGFLLRAAGLLEDVRITSIVAAGKIGGGRFTAKIAIDALIIDVVFAGNVVGIFICNVSHNFFCADYNSSEKQGQAF
jgi:hypothetical protein